MTIDKLETKTQEIIYIFSTAAAFLLVFTGITYLHLNYVELPALTGNTGLLMIQSLFSSLGFSTFFLAFSFIHIGKFLIKNMSQASDIKKVYRRLLTKTTFELGAILLLASLLTVMQNYWQVEGSHLLKHGAGGILGNVVGGSLFTHFGLYGSLTILTLTLMASLILSENLHLAGLFLATKDHTKTLASKLKTTSNKSAYLLAKNVNLLSKKLRNISYQAIKKQTGKELNFLKVDVSKPKTITPPPLPPVHEIVPPVPTSASQPVKFVIQKEHNNPISKVKTQPIRKPLAGNINAVTEVTEFTEAAPKQEVVDKKIEIQAYRKRYNIPAAEILDTSSPSKEMSPQQIKEQCADLQERLAAFGINGEIMNASIGARLTMFEFKPAQGVRLSKLISLTDDLALMLGADSIRILAPIPGKTTVGIEVPNKTPQMVMMGDMLKDLKKAAKTMKLPIAIGKDVNNNTIVDDITKMPHMMVSGTTGSGKSVFINNLIVSLLYTQSPKKLRFLMIDPKMIELSPYNGIPHLLKPVVTDLNEAKDALVWAQDEMDRRYSLFAEFGARDIDSFNTLVANNDKKFYERKLNKEIATSWTELPQIVIIVDELADLMITQGKDVEIPITRIAQKARAAGIHLIIATQRPSAEVVTGLIKTNFPTRTAFKVSSSIDSRTILDSSGAEKLLGNGDMLFMANGKSISRFQSAYISEDEVRKLVEDIS